MSGVDPHVSMPVPSQTDSPRRDRRHTSEGRSGEPRRSQSHLSNIESSVTRLLVATKQLLEGLTSWSRNMMTETQVSDIYVKLGNEFNMACAAFTAVNIDTSDLGHVPDELRVCLERCLSEDASPSILEQFLPQIREIIIFLLQGLKTKQMSYRSRQPRSSRSSRSQTNDDEASAEKNGTSGSLRRSNARNSQRISGVSSPKTPDSAADLTRSPSGNSFHSPIMETAEEHETAAEGTNGAPAPALPARPSRERNLAVNDPMAALKKSDALERRASRRFSAYAFAKISGAPIPASNEDSPRRSRTKSNDKLASPAARPSDEVIAQRKAQAAMNGVDTAKQPEDKPMFSPPPPIPKVEEEEAESPASPSLSSVLMRPQTAPQLEDASAPKTLFLQLGKDVKKTHFEGQVTIPALRMLFVERFAYTPGTGDFPGIYIREPTSGVQYELEDLSEVHNHSLLSLNVEALDEVKKHIDTSISGLAQELKSLKQSMNESNELMLKSVAKASQVVVNAMPASPHPSEATFNAAARKVTQKVDTLSQERAAVDLRTQYDNVQHLRRDLATMRQIYNEFVSDTKTTMKTLQSQAEDVKQAVSAAPVSGARGLVDAGKTRVDAKSQDLITRMEELQDTVDALKLDLTQRRARISPVQIKRTTDEMQRVESDLNELSSELGKFKPQWKKTWESELQNIVDEQQFLNHQVQLSDDLLADFTNVKGIFENISKVYEHQAKTNTGGRKEYQPPTPDEHHEGIKTVMLEVEGLNVDSQKRLKAIQAAEKLRQKELSNRIDEFTQELSGFVEGKKLKRVGGADEVERVRAKKDESAWKTMFQSAGPPPNSKARATSGPSGTSGAG